MNHNPSHYAYSRNSSGTEIGTRYRYIDDTPLVPFSENATSTSAAGATAQTRSRPSNEYVLYAYGEPIAMTADGNASYFGTDILGSVRNVTDKYGNVQANYNYDAFGAPYLSNLDNDMSFGYCGKAYDNGTGLYDYGFRDYAPNQARFTTIDPIRDGNNWFAYVVNDPVNYVDPFGLTSTDQAYEVQPGDCLWEIAAQANNKDGGNRTAQQLAEQNNIANPDLIYPGDIIYIPSTPTPPSQPAPSAPAPAAPAPAAPAPTVPTPSVPSAPPVSTGNAFTTRNTYDSSITHDQWEQIAMLYGFSEEPTVAGKTWAEAQQFFKENPNGLIYRYGDEIFYRFLKSKNEIIDPNADNAKLMLILLGAKGIGKLVGNLAPAEEAAAVQQIQIQSMKFLDMMHQGNTALVFESFIELNKTSKGRELLKNMGRFYGAIIEHVNQNCVSLVTTMQDWINSFGGN